MIRALRGVVMQRVTLLPTKRGILFPKRIPLLKSPEKGEGPSPSTPHIGSLDIEELHALRNRVRCTWLRHEPLLFVITLNRALLS